MRFIFIKFFHFKYYLGKYLKFLINLKFYISVWSVEMNLIDWLVVAKYFSFIRGYLCLNIYRKIKGPEKVFFYKIKKINSFCDSFHSAGNLLQLLKANA